MPHMNTKKRLWQQAYRRRTGNADTKKYEKSPRGFIMRAYRNMTSRVTGVQWRKAHLYKGLAILPKDAFYTWAWHSLNFWQLYRVWVQSGHDRRLTPSVNRIDPTKGYMLGNIEWLTHSINSSLGNKSRYARLRLAVLQVLHDA